MATETPILSGYSRGADAVHPVFTRSQLPTRFCPIMKNSREKEKVLFYEEWLNRVCIGVMIVAVLYFVPAAIQALQK